MLPDSTMPYIANWLANKSRGNSPGPVSNENVTADNGAHASIANIARLPSARSHNNGPFHPRMMGVIPQAALPASAATGAINRIARQSRWNWSKPEAPLGRRASKAPGNAITPAKVTKSTIGTKDNGNASRRAQAPTTKKSCAPESAIRKSGMVTGSSVGSVAEKPLATLPSGAGRVVPRGTAFPAPSQGSAGRGAASPLSHRARAPVPKSSAPQLTPAAPQPACAQPHPTPAAALAVSAGLVPKKGKKVPLRKSELKYQKRGVVRGG